MSTQILTKKPTNFAIKIDLDACSGCGICYEVCPEICFGEPVNGKAVIIENNIKKCMGCLGCELQCPEKAIKIIEF